MSPFDHPMQVSTQVQLATSLQVCLASTLDIMHFLSSLKKATVETVAKMSRTVYIFSQCQLFIPFY